MHIVLRASERTIAVTREQGDSPLRSESQMLYAVKRWLAHEYGFDCIKKEAAKDGHLVSQGMYYLRLRARRGTPASANYYAGARLTELQVYDELFGLRDTAKEYNTWCTVRLVCHMAFAKTETEGA